MSKSIKLKNNNYLDSSGITYNRKTLKTILDIETITLTFNDTYVYSTDLDYICLKIGKLVILSIHIIAFKQQIPNLTTFISGLPKPYTNTIFYLYGGNMSKGTTGRCCLYNDGTIRTHWGEPSSYGDSANKQYGGTLIYKTSE